MLGKSVSVITYRQRQEPPLPRERRQRGGVCARKRVGCQGWENLFPTAARGYANGEGDTGCQRPGHREHDWVCQGAGNHRLMNKAQCTLPGIKHGVGRFKCRTTTITIPIGHPLGRKSRDHSKCRGMGIFR